MSRAESRSARLVPGLGVGAVLYTRECHWSAGKLGWFLYHVRPKKPVGFF